MGGGGPLRWSATARTYSSVCEMTGEGKGELRAVVLLLMYQAGWRLGACWEGRVSEEGSMGSGGEG